MKSGTDHAYPPRIKAFRSGLVKLLPKVPNNREAAERLESQTTNNLILTFLTWRMRFVPATPRSIKRWSGWSAGLDPGSFFFLRPSLEEFRTNVESGDDLMPYLSTRVNRSAFAITSGHAPAEIDFVLPSLACIPFIYRPPLTRNQNVAATSLSLLMFPIPNSTFLLFRITTHSVLDHRRGVACSELAISTFNLKSRKARFIC